MLFFNFFGYYEKPNNLEIGLVLFLSSDYLYSFKNDLSMFISPLVAGDLAVGLSLQLTDNPRARGSVLPPNARGMGC